MNKQGQLSLSIIYAFAASFFVMLICVFLPEDCFFVRYASFFSCVVACATALTGEHKEILDMFQRISVEKAKYLLISLIFMLSARLLQSLIEYLGIAIFNQSQIVEKFTGENAIIVLLDIVIVTPLWEEFLFRFSIFHLIKNEKIATVLSITLFALPHAMYNFSGTFILEGFLVLILYSIPGYSFSYVYRKTNNYWFAVIAHAINNLPGAIGILLK